MLIMSNRNTLRSRFSRKGFTLIELLAVIVILAIIALIAVPQVIKILNKARMSAALDSSDGFIKAVENKIVLEEMKDEENKITDGTYLVNALDIDYKGKGPSSGVVVVEKMNIKNARLCINNYSIDYDGEKSSISDSNYCDTDQKLIISINGNEEEIVLTDSLTYTYDLTSDILSSATNISCNNSAVPSIAGNSLKIDNVYGNTLCSVSGKLTDSIDNLDNNTMNYILMVNNDVVDSYKRVFAKTNFNINGNEILMDSALGIYSDINVYDTLKSGKMIVRNGDSAFNMGEYANLYIDYVNILQDYDNSAINKNGIWLSSGCTGCNLEVKDANIDVGKNAIGLNDSSKNSSVNIFNGTFNSENNSAVFYAGTNNIININGGLFTSNNGYAFRSDVSSTGILTINGGTFNSETTALFHASASNYKICGGNLNGKNYDIYNDSTGIIYYKKQDILNNNSIYSKNADTVILDPNLDCSR